MSQDGKSQPVMRLLRNDKPNVSEVACACGGTFYAAPRSRYAVCTGGEVRCTVCHRPAKRFGKAYTCGIGCKPCE